MGGLPDLDLSLLSFSQFLWAFPDFSGIFPIGSFPLSRPMKAPTGNIPERVCDTIGPPGLPSRNFVMTQAVERRSESDEGYAFL